MHDFTEKTRRQRINQRNRTERLSDLLDWKRMGLEYIKARQLSLKRAYPHMFKNGANPFQNGLHLKLTRPALDWGTTMVRMVKKHHIL
mgnify:CR=1 FL=1